jgi:SAM-dependent methyltransferase
VTKLVREETAQTFEAIYADGYDKKYPSIDLVRLEGWYFNKIPGRALDYGCGPGTNGLHLLDSAYEVVFTDVAREALKKVEAKLASRTAEISEKATVRPIEWSADRLPDDDQSYDYIICLSVLGNLEDANSVRALLGEFHRILKPGGKIIVDINGEDSTYVKESSAQLSDQTYRVRPSKDIASDDIVMYFPKSAPAFAEMVTSAGFHVDDIGHSSFAYQGHDGYEYLVCANKA